MADFTELFGEELVLLVFSFLPVPDLLNVARVNHTWQRIASDQQLFSWLTRSPFSFLLIFFSYLKFYFIFYFIFCNHFVLMPSNLSYWWAKKRKEKKKRKKEKSAWMNEE